MNNAQENTQEISPFSAPKANLEIQGVHEDGPFKLNILSPKGRLGRMRFFTFSYLLLLIFGIISAVMLPTARIGAEPDTTNIIPVGLMSLFWMYLATMLSVKRLHDINASGLWLLLPIGLIILSMVAAGIIAAKNPSSDTAVVTTILIVATYSLSCLIMGIVLIFFPGTKSENQFGSPTPPNSVGVKVGFFLILALFALTVINATYQYSQYINRGL